MSEWISTKENPDGDIKPEDIGKYTNLHAHSVYSPLDGYGKLEEYCKRAVALGMKGLCLSEHGNMIGHKEQEKMCRKHGIKPIYANEGYVTLHSGSIKEKIEGYKANYHLLLIAMNLTGYMNLMKATSIAWTRYKYFKPRFDFDLLQECQEGLICTSACLGGPINQLYLDGKAEEAEQIALRLKEIFGERFYLEKTYTGLEEQDIANKNLSEISRKHNIPMIITCDSHYVYPWQSDSHAKLVLVNTGGFINKKAKNEASLTDTKNDESDVDNNSMFYQPGQYYLKPHHVLVEEYYNTEEDAIAFENTNKIAEMCEVELPTPEEMVFPKPYEDPDTVLRERAMQWYADYSVNLNDEDKKIYLDRLEEELITYEKMGFSSYPLVLSEILDEAKAKGIMIGPGRGCCKSNTLVFVKYEDSEGHIIEAFKAIKELFNESYNHYSVMNMNGEWVGIKNVQRYSFNHSVEPLITINGVTSTIDHKHYVLDADTNSFEFKKAFSINPDKDKLYFFYDKEYKLIDIYEFNIIEAGSNFKCTEVFDIEVDCPTHSYTILDEKRNRFITHNSAAGSLLSYALGITNINPIPYGLIFSRYLNAGRAKYPLIEFEGYPLEEYL